MLLTLSSCSTYEYMYDYSDPVYEETYTTHDPVVTTTNSHYVIIYRMNTSPWQRPWDSMWYYDRPYSGYNYNYTNWGYNYNYNPCSYWSPFMPGYNPYWNTYNGYYPYYNSGYYTWGSGMQQPPTWYGHRKSMGEFNTHRFYKNKPMTKTSMEKAPVRLVDKIDQNSRTRTVNTDYKRPTQKAPNYNRYQQPTRTNTQNYNRNQPTRSNQNTNTYQQPTRTNTQNYNNRTRTNQNTNRYQAPKKPSTPTYNRGGKGTVKPTIPIRNDTRGNKRKN